MKIASSYLNNSAYQSIDNMQQLKETKKFDEILQKEKENKIQNKSTQEQNKELVDACQQFESYFLNVMMKQMRNTVQRSDLIPNSQAESIFTEMLDEEYTKNASKAGGIGLADMMIKQLSK